MKKLLNHDEALNACKTLVYFLNKKSESENKDSNLNNYMESLFKDFCFRLKDVNYNNKIEVMLNSCDYLYNKYSDYDHKDSVKKSIEVLRRSNINKEKNSCDVGIVTILGTEQRAGLKAFGIDERRAPTKTPRKHAYWEFSSTNKNGGDITIALTRVGAQRNVQCALAVQDMVQEYNPKIIILLGIAAGTKPKVKTMDVVFGTQIHDYEGARLEKEGSQPRPLNLNAYEKADDWFEDLTFPASQDYINSEIKKISASSREWDNIISLDSINIELHKGTLISGEKLLADGSLDKKRQNLDERIRAGDMEAVGFVQAAIMYDKEYAIFRGISDYGDIDKPTDDIYHFPAALSAALAVNYFITEVWDHEGN